MSPTVGPLAGIRVLDLTQIVAGPICTFYLASLGAEVIRIERPGGDLTWRVPPFYGPRGGHRDPRRPDEISLSAMKRQRGKRSVVVSLREAEGAQLVASLAERSDVLVENFRPGVMARLGLGWETLEVRNPALVYCSISGYGQGGPARDRQATDFTVQAATGLMAKTGYADGPPVKTGFPVGDLGPATFAALGVMAALRQRDQTGKGQRVDVSMYDALVSWLWDDPLDEYEDTDVPERTGNREPRGSPSNTYRCADGWVNVVATDDRQWSELTRILESPDLARHDSNVARVAANDEIDDAIVSWCRARTTGEVVRVLRAAEVPVAEVRPPWQARNDEHAQARGILEPLRYRDDAGEVTTDRLGGRFPVQFSASDVRTGPAELLGASTDAVLREVLGMDDAALADLRARGIIGA